MGSRKVVRLLEAEAGINDPVAIALAVALVGAAGTGHIHASSIVWTTVREGTLGVAIGLAAGLLAARVLGPRWPTVTMVPPLAVLAGGFATFGLAALAHGSGFVAVYLFGLVLGDDVDLPEKDAVRAFGEQLASLAEISMFLLLGVALAQVPLRDSVVDALVMTIVVVLVVRPLLVYPALRALHRSRDDAIFATFGGLKGAVPICSPPCRCRPGSRARSICSPSRGSWSLCPWPSRDRPSDDSRPGSRPRAQASIIRSASAMPLGRPAAPRARTGRSR